MISYYFATSAIDYEDARQLFKEYADFIAIDLSFQKFTTELEDLQAMYILPFGGIILAKENEEVVACIGIRKFDDAIGEIKRMYVKPTAQGKGIATILLENILSFAVTLGYKKLRLDTLDTMTAAIHLYGKKGFYKTAAYYHNPITNAVYFEKLL